MVKWQNPRKMAGFGLISDGVPEPIGRDYDSRLPGPPPGSIRVDVDKTQRMRRIK